MIQVLKIDVQAGGKTLCSPRLIGEILRELFQSDEPFATGYRQFLAEQHRKAPWEPTGLVGKKGEVRE